MRLYRHSWPGPGIWCSWTVGCVLSVADICAIIEIRSLVLARDDAIVNTVLLFCGCSLFKDRRTNELHWKSNAHSSKLDARLLFQCCCIFDAESTTTFAEKNRSYYSITIVAIQSFLAGTRNLMFMDCRKRYFCRWHLCHHWDKIPGPGQGWRCRGHYAVALWKYTFKRQKNIRTKDLHWIPNTHSSELNAHLPFNVSAS